MKTFLKIGLSLLVIVALAAGAGTAYVYARYPAVPPAESLTIHATPETLARGQYLFEHVSLCVDCHSTRDWSKYGAPVLPGTIGKGGDLYGTNIGLPGDFYARNITPAGLGEWTDGEIVRAVTTGVDRDGEPLFPIMPYPRYGRMAKDDVEAIVAYLRTIPAISNTVPAHTFNFPMQFVTRTIPAPAQFSTRPAPDDTVKYGEYVTNAAACTDCHTPQVQGASVPGMDFAGGMEFPLPAGGYVRSANITADAGTGIGTWTEQQFVDKFTALAAAPDQVLTAPEDRKNNTVMPWKAYGGMTREDLAAIYAYLRSLPPVVHRVEKHGDTPQAP
ncbi:MAG TPA: cytochrome c [Vicinamibacterales bacterium]|nr:cytochrome c [Vicinamibacterales bacterium]